MRWIRVATVVGTVLGGLVVAAVPAAAATAVRCDFDGDGTADLAVGVPGEDGIGAVNVQYQRTGPLADPAILREDWLPRGSAYGAALTCGDFNADGVGDLAVGAPGAYEAAGKMFVYSGRAGFGLDKMTMFSQGSSTPGFWEPNDRLGWSLAAGDLDGDAIDDLVVGIPGDADPHWRAPGHRKGSVLVIHGSAKGLRFDDTVEQVFGWTVHGAAEYADTTSFGWSVAVGQFRRGGAAELAVGAPRVSPRRFAGDDGAYRGGRVYTFQRFGKLAPDRALTQDDAEIGPGAEDGDGFGWSLAAGDLNGDGHDDLAVGAPFEAVGEVRDAGQVSVFGGSSTSVGWGGADTATAADEQHPAPESALFGWSVAVGDHDADGRADLAVGAPHQEVAGQGLAGAAYLLPGTAGLVGPGTMLTAGAGGLPGPADEDDRFGMAVGFVGLSGTADLLVGAPGVDCPGDPGSCPAGAVTIVPGADSGAAPLRLHQDTKSPTPVTGTREPGGSPLPFDDTPGEEPDGPQPPEAEGEWFGYALAS